jgi:hypothetical protein
MLDPTAVANLGGCDPRQVAGCGYLIAVVRDKSGGSVFAQMVKNDRDAEALRQRIERDDLEIIAIVVASIQAGIF